MDAMASCLPARSPFLSSLSQPRPRCHRAPPSFPAFKSKRPSCRVLQSNEEEVVIGEDDQAASLPKEFYDDEMLQKMHHVASLCSAEMKCCMFMLGCIIEQLLFM